MARADELFEQYKGSPVEVSDPSNKNQCMDWAFKYCQLIGIPFTSIRHLFAYQVYTEPTAETRKYFDLVPNSPNYVPPAGSLAVWGTKVGRAGHIAVVLSGSTRTNLVTADQNWNGHSYVERVNHANYYGVIGFLVPKTSAVPAIVVQNGGTYEAVSTANVRIAPRVNANLGGSRTLTPGTRFVVKRIVPGDAVNGNSNWAESQFGNFVWTGNLRKVS